MTTYVTIPDTDVDQDSPVTVALMTALRDNPIAIADGGGGPILGLTMLSTSGEITGSPATVEFTGFRDDARYDAYLFEYLYINLNLDGISMAMRTSTNGGSSYDSTTGDYGVSTGNLMPVSNAIGNAAGEAACGTVVLFAPDDAANKTYIYATGVSITGTPAVATFSNGNFRDAIADVDAVQFLTTNASGTYEGGKITVYGRGRV